MQLYVFNLTEELFLSLNGKNSHQNKQQQKKLALTAIYTPIHSKKEKSDALI